MKESARAKIGIGIITYNRPDYFRRCIESILTILPFVDEIVVYNDGSKKKYDLSYLPKRVVVKNATKNKGVAAAKNWCFKELLKRDCSFIFICEDDMEILDRQAIAGYIAAYRLTGFPHLNFHGHGNNLFREPIGLDKRGLYFWPNAVGAWSFYTKIALEAVGLMDENFYNAYEHIEHSWRIYKDHISYGFWPDVMGSEGWIRPQADAIKNSSIRRDEKKWKKNITRSLEYWRAKDPDCPVEDPIL